DARVRHQARGRLAAALDPDRRARRRVVDDGAGPGRRRARRLRAGAGRRQLHPERAAAGRGADCRIGRSAVDCRDYRIAAARGAGGAGGCGAGVARGVTRSRPLFQVLVEPGDDAVEAVDEVLLLAQPVRLARVDDEIRLDVVALQPAVELLALTDRIGFVGF